MADIESLDAHEYPPAVLRQMYRKYRSANGANGHALPVLDFQQLDGSNLPEGLYLEKCLSPDIINSAFDQFVGVHSPKEASGAAVKPIPVYAHRDIPGLQILPSLLPPSVQIELLDRLLHRDLTDERHQTNIHLHYNVTYPPKSDGTSGANKMHSTPTEHPSFFADDPDRLISPKDSSVHKPISIRSLLNRKLRWMTLGGQYNWTDKRYPTSTPPPFPPDVATLLHRIFPETEPEAAIVNVYSPGDTLNVHRDVSEECDTGLISISFGCEGLFMVGHADNSNFAVIKLRSGDAVYMNGASRFSWHAVPKIIPSTCPSSLQDWPGRDDNEGDDMDRLRQWQGWMSGKRVNLNVRQMKPATPNQPPHKNVDVG